MFVVRMQARRCALRREIPPVFEIFSNRMEFTSYGGLISGQSREDFFSCSSMPRNRELMRVFKDVGLVEQLGSGMSRILKYYDKDIFTISDHFIKVVFPFSDKNTINEMGKNKNKAESGVINGTINEDGTINGIINGTINDIDEEKKIIVAKMSENPHVTIKAMSSYTGYSVRKVNRIIKELKEFGIVERKGANKTGYWEIHK